MSVRVFVVVFTVFCLSLSVRAQQSNSVNWITFEQLEDSLTAQLNDSQPKKVFIDFFTDWCTYCRKMDKVVFTKLEVINLLNDQYFAVRFDAESDIEIRFGGQTLINDQIGQSRKPVHQIAQILALREGKFTPPTMIVLDQDFNVTARYFEYMDSKKLIQALK